MAANAVNEFGQQLLSQWRPEHGGESVVFSPLSIAMCFLLVYNGAHNRTKTELEDVFGFDDENVEKGLLSKLTKYSGESFVKMANRVYIERSAALKEAFEESIGDANVESTDFAHEFEKARDGINAWVSERTAESIPNLIPRGVLSANTILVAVNALYFKGKWETRFPVYGTESGIFHGVGGNQRVPFMTQKGNSFRVKELDALDGMLFAMPYEKGSFTMYVLLPNKQDGWTQAEKDLSFHVGTLFSDGFTERTVETLKLPKWEKEMQLQPLKEMLEDIGLSTAFSSLADFSGIAEDRSLFISEVMHKAKVIVDEEGTEATAATAVVANTASVGFADRPSFNIIVDHPYLYFIVDEVDGTVLFQGTQTTI